jgi:hypothetical protein
VRSTKQIVVTKQDGTLERFNLAKLTGCLAGAMRGHAYDPRLASPLAKAVALHLQDWPHSNPPTTDYIYRCARAVLQQTGLADVADELASHRRQRRTRRRRVRVVDAALPEARGEQWRKSALVHTLQTRYGLRHSVSRFVAGQIEAQVFALDHRAISRTFLAELVRNEVLAWGLVDGRVQQMDVPAYEPPVGTHRPEEEI